MADHLSKCLTLAKHAWEGVEPEVKPTTITPAEHAGCMLTMKKATALALPTNAGGIQTKSETNNNCSGHA